MKTPTYQLILIPLLMCMCIALGLGGCQNGKANLKAVGQDLLADAKNDLAPALFKALTDAAIQEATTGKVDLLHSASAALNSLTPQTAGNVTQIVNDATGNKLPGLATLLGNIVQNSATAYAAANAISGVAMTTTK